jgi:hypothetical protein
MRKNLYKKLYTKIRHNRKGKVVSKLTVLAHSGRVGPLRVTSRNPNEVTTPNRYLRDFFSSNLAVLWCQTEESKQRLCVQRHKTSRSNFNRQTT